MLISHRKKFIYTKTVKTAGTSVESYFERYCMADGQWEFAHHRDQYVGPEGIIGCRGPDAGGKEWFNHMSAADIRSRVGTEMWDEYYKFCVVRNPFDKLVSWFSFQLHKGLLAPATDQHVVDAFRERLSQGIPVLDRDKYVIDGSLCVDYAIRFEDLEHGIGHVCRKLSVPFERARVPHLKGGIRDTSLDLRDFYTPELVRNVESAYAFEFQTFGYRWGDRQP
jgi:hypothetical protein